MTEVPIVNAERYDVIVDARTYTRTCVYIRVYAPAKNGSLGGLVR